MALVGGKLSKVSRIGAAALFALASPLAGVCAGGARGYDRIATREAGPGAIDQQSETPPDPPTAPPTDQEPRQVPIGMTPAGVADKARSDAGEPGSTTRLPAAERTRENPVTPATPDKGSTACPDVAEGGR